MSFNVKRLIEAEKRGEAEEFARQRDIKLVDGSVTVIIECEDGKVEDVARGASNYGTIVLSYKNLLQVVVPITSLRDLAKIPGVHLVRLPWVASEE